MCWRSQLPLVRARSKLPIPSAHSSGHTGGGPAPTPCSFPSRPPINSTITKVGDCTIPPKHHAAVGDLDVLVIDECSMLSAGESLNAVSALSRLSSDLHADAPPALRITPWQSYQQRREFVQQAVRPPPMRLLPARAAIPAPQSCCTTWCAMSRRHVCCSSGAPTASGRPRAAWLRCHSAFQLPSVVDYPPPPPTHPPIHPPTHPTDQLTKNKVATGGCRGSRAASSAG